MQHDMSAPTAGVGWATDTNELCIIDVGGEDDRFDAYVLADTLRTDGHRLASLTPDSDQTPALRPIVRARTDLIEARVAVCNQLRAHLRIVFPGAVGLFRDLDSPISLTFLTRFPTAERAAWLSHKRPGAWPAAALAGGAPTSYDPTRHGGNQPLVEHNDQAA